MGWDCLRLVTYKGTDQEVNISRMFGAKCLTVGEGS